MRAALLVAIILLVGVSADGGAVEPLSPAHPPHAVPAIGFSTYLGGLASEDLPRLALGADGTVFVVGSTASPDFPTRGSAGVSGPLAATIAGDVDVFVAKLDESGTQIVFATYLGGSGMDRGAAIAVDADGGVWITGQTTSADFPATGGSFGGGADAFVAKLSAAGDEVEFGAFIGGSGVEAGTGLAIDTAGDVYVVGTTTSPDFPTSAPLQGELGAPGDAFVVKFDGAERRIVYATYLGGDDSDDRGFGIAVDEAGSAYVTGSAGGAFPVARPLQTAYGGAGDAFVAKLDPAGATLIYATNLGGSDVDAGLAIAVDADGGAYITGQTMSSDFPTLSPVQQFPGGGPDAFVTKLSADGQSVVYSTFLGGEGADVGGGIAVDGAGNAHVTGMTGSPDFPAENSLQPFFGGGSDVFISRLSDTGAGLTYSTFSGGGGADAGIGIVVDGAGNAYVAGQTSSTDFPTFNPLQAELHGPQDVFVSKYCLSLVFPQEREFASGPGADAFSVTTPAGCAWIAFSQAPWIEMTTPNVVAGSSEVQFAVGPNGSGLPRAGSLNIAGRQVTVMQEAATDCAYEIAPASENFYMLGGVGRIDVAARDDCPWAAVSNTSWIALSGPDRGVGAGVVSYTIQENRTGRQRSGTITVAGQTFVVFDWLRDQRN